MSFIKRAFSCYKKYKHSVSAVFITMLLLCCLLLVIHFQKADGKSREVQLIIIGIGVILAVCKTVYIIIKEKRMYKNMNNEQSESVKQ